MLIFELDQNAGRVRLDPCAVDCVVETERRGQAGLKQVAEIVLRNGARYVVADPERTVGEEIIVAAKETHAVRAASSERIARALETLGLQGA